MDHEALALTAIVNRLIASKGDIHSVWMNMDYISVALKYYDSLVFYSKHIQEIEKHIRVCQAHGISVNESN
jgi:hypothetical protein